MRDVRFGGAFAFAGLLAVGPAKGFQEIGGDLRVGKLDGAEAERVFLAEAAVLVAQIGPELGRHAGDLRVGIEQHFGHEPAWIVTGEEARVRCVPRQRRAAALISLGLENGAHERFEVELLIGQILRGGRKKLFVAGRIGRAQVIYRVRDSNAEEICPDAIHN